MNLKSNRYHEAHIKYRPRMMELGMLPREDDPTAEDAAADKPIDATKGTDHV